LAYLNSDDWKLEDSTPLIWQNQERSGEKSQGLIVFDRDGTLIVDRGQDNNRNLLEFLPNTIPTIQLIAEFGYSYCIATNQSGFSRALFSLNELHEFHSSMCEKFYDLVGLGPTLVALCPHSPLQGCSCRKPEAGLLVAIEQYSYQKPMLMVGDKETDIQAGERYGIDTILVEEDNMFNLVRKWITK